MNPAAAFLLLSTLFAATASASFNITAILLDYPDYSQFSDLLTQQGVASDINNRATITVLAVPNSQIGDITGVTTDLQKKILTIHVILDYYDEAKLAKLSYGRNVITTLFQSSGSAVGRQGFLNVANGKDGIVFGSAVQGSPLDAKFEGEVYTKPYNVSVIRISKAIVPNGMDGNWRAAPTGTVKAKSPPTPAPVSEIIGNVPDPSPSSSAPTVADSPEAEVDDTPSPDTESAPGSDEDATPSDDLSNDASVVCSTVSRMVAMASFLVAIF